MIDLFQTIRIPDLSEYYSNMDMFDINSLDENSGNLLHEAIPYGQSEIAVDLISRGIDVNQMDCEGQTPLHYAAAHSRVDLANEVLTAGGDVNIRDKYGNNSLWTAVFNSRGKYEIVELFVANGGDALTKNHANRSPLDFANQINDIRLVEILTSK